MQIHVLQSATVSRHSVLSKAFQRNLPMDQHKQSPKPYGYDGNNSHQYGDSGIITAITGKLVLPDSFSKTSTDFFYGIKNNEKQSSNGTYYSKNLFVSQSERPNWSI